MSKLIETTWFQSSGASLVGVGEARVTVASCVWMFVGRRNEEWLWVNVLALEERWWYRFEMGERGGSGE
jgi:hypothetical protein